MMRDITRGANNSPGLGCALMEIGKHSKTNDTINFNKTFF